MTRRRKPTPNSLDHLEAGISHLLDQLEPYQRELAAAVGMLLGTITTLNLLGLGGGGIPAFLGRFMSGLFGWGTIPLTLALMLWCTRLILERSYPQLPRVPLESVVGLELIILAALAILHLLFGGNTPLATAQAGEGGGFVGWALSILLLDTVGRNGGLLIFGVLALVGIGVVLRFGLLLTASPALSSTSEPGAPIPAKVNPDSLPSVEAKTEPRIPPPEPVPVPPKPAQRRQPVINQPGQISKATGKAKAPQRPNLPPLSVLTQPAIGGADADQADARYQAQVIEDTLTGFNIPAEVVEVNVGPTVTQFGVKPGTLAKKLPDGRVVEQRIRVNRISALANDLALALAAAPIRIETPMPGRPLVGIEVPNGAPSMVSLRQALENDEFWRNKGVLKTGLGMGMSGKMITIDLAAMPHLLIAGATGAGKSVCINALMTSLLMSHTPETLRLLMIDPKMVELVSYNGIPHLISPVVTDFEQVGGALAWVTREMERRYRLFATSGSRSIGGYNRKATADEKLPYLVVVIDELADLMMLAADEVERYICRIAQMARATGIHLVVATQRPSTDVVTGLIKANFPARIAFAVSSQIDSRVILDSPGAEKLLGRGDMLFMAPDAAQLMRLQGCFVSEAEINAVVTFWKRQVTMPVNPLPNVDEVEELPWADILADADKDDLLKEAIELVMQSGRASTTMLQRKLGIGYPRASRLMDQLEAEGVIGPAEGNQPRTVLWAEAGTEENPV